MGAASIVDSPSHRGASRFREKGQVFFNTKRYPCMYDKIAAGCISDL